MPLEVLQSSIVMVSFCCLYMCILGYHSWWADWAAATSCLSANQPIRGQRRGRCVFGCCLKTFFDNKEEASFKTFREGIRSLEEKSRVESS